MPRACRDGTMTESEQRYRERKGLKAGRPNTLCPEPSSAEILGFGRAGWFNAVSSSSLSGVLLGMGTMVPSSIFSRTHPGPAAI